MKEGGRAPSEVVCVLTHRHTAVGANLCTNLHLAMQIDHTQVDEGEYLHRHARCAGVPVAEHFGVLI